MFRKIDKALHILFAGDPLWRRALRLGIGAAIEHVPSLKAMGPMTTVVDIGANRGQFALAARHVWPGVRIFSFEPLDGPAECAGRLFAHDDKFRLYRAAIAPQAGVATMHVAARDDSSSLLPIGEAQTKIFPGTEEVATVEVETGPLDVFLKARDIEPAALLKLDVQGFELEVLKGCEPLLDRFAAIYVECSFLPLYEGQALADEVIA
ncbi:MAG: FkbM family methyltransferase, partial [Alphaproteobacteria bacterium]